MTAPDRSEISSGSDSADGDSGVVHAVGIDVSKASLEVALLGKEAPPASRTVPNTEDGFAELISWIDQQAHINLERTPKQVHVCLEASGGYQRPVARHLHEHGLTVSVVNPRRTSAYANSQLTRSKTDRVDARLLARFCQREEPSPWQPSSSARRDLKEMNRGLEQLKKERNRLQNQIDQAGHEAVVDALDAVLERVNQQIGELKRCIDEHVQQCRQLNRKRELLETIPGVGTGTATRVIAELGDVDRFDSARQAAAYAGLTPSHHTSGSSVQKRPRMSKIGNSRLRRALYFPALTALRCNAAIEALGQRLAERGKAKMVIIGAAMRKLLHICFGVLKNGAPFDPSLHPGT